MRSDLTLKLPFTACKIPISTETVTCYGDCVTNSCTTVSSI